MGRSLVWPSARASQCQAQPGCPPALPGNPSHWCQANCASPMDVEVPDLPGSRGSLAGPCPTCVWRTELWSHPAEFPKGWNRVGRQHETCGRGWMAPRAGAWNSGPSWSKGGLAYWARFQGLCSFHHKDPLKEVCRPWGWAGRRLVSRLHVGPQRQWEGRAGRWGEALCRVYLRAVWRGWELVGCRGSRAHLRAGPL